MTVKMELKELIKVHRKRAGLSQNELAVLAGVGKTVIFDLEKGKETVQWRTVNAVLHALNIQICYQSPLKEYNEES
ncbi:MAG TPA: transcriptional regulator [Candidatus Marinimicrobia bacterium]|nr:transcriptional regulator [Candidatus Neomarinimicrobiota bacterium]